MLAFNFEACRAVPAHGHELEAGEGGRLVLKFLPHINQLHIIRTALAHTLQDLLQVLWVKLLNWPHRRPLSCSRVQPPAQGGWQTHQVSRNYMSSMPHMLRSCYSPMHEALWAPELFLAGIALLCIDPLPLMLIWSMLIRFILPLLGNAHQMASVGNAY